jgi:hypothetical protein
VTGEALGETGRKPLQRIGLADMGVVAGHHPAVASGRVQDLLALEIPRSARKAQNRA